MRCSVWSTIFSYIKASQIVTVRFLDGGVLDVGCAGGSICRKVAVQDRPYQEEAHKAFRSEFDKGVTHQLASMATGTGKTVVFSQLPTRLKDVLPGQQLILAHREELIDQAIDKMRTINPELRVDKEMANHKADPSIADCVVASVATLGRAGSSRMAHYNWVNFDKFVADEAHHSIAPSYLNIFEGAGLMQPGDKRLLLGVTATPQRGDGKALAQLYQKITFTYSMRQAIEDGWLVEPCGIVVKTKTSLDGIKTVAGDYATEQLADTVNTPQRNQMIVKAWQDNATGRQTIAFTVNIQHALDLAAMFREYGIKAEAIWGDDPDRAEKLIRHKAGEITILTNCGVLTEGYDDWRIGCVILARPTKSSVLFTQMVGRGTRIEPGIGNLIEYRKVFDIPTKVDCLIIDVVDSSSRHSLITLPTLMGLSAYLDLHGGGVVKAVRKLEDAQRQFPHIDFNSLVDLADLETHIQKVNLFDIKFAPEVEASSELSWYPAPTGGYVLLLPNKDTIRIQQNMLDKFEISGIIRGQRYRGERDTIEAAFTAADTVIQNTCQDALKVLRREESWHGQQATSAQLKLLTKFFKGKPLPLDLTKGKASRLISSYYAGKAA
jgi:ATP-dependent helicase IRC3